ncbi:hypothetical protein [Parabacteroides sp. FAFU027]|uniref:hypothetical protein n=1 Tax=Parabacteroides sp. FAFU027 TaxID=2922715 RepID=UPI001FAF0606|nr:hypothetical protein [Parabacteroides sp. FAFU027]
MNTLFDDDEMGTLPQPQPEIKQSIKIVPSKDKPLSKQQQTFNRLTKRIENLQKEIAIESEKLELILGLYSEKIPSLEIAIAEKQIKLAKKLSYSSRSIKYGKRQLENLGQVIVYLLNEAFTSIEPDEETEALYDQWSETSFSEEKELQETEMRMMMEDMLREQMGIDLDLSDMDDSPEAFARMQQKIKEELDKKTKEEKHQNANKTKTKKQLEKELKLKEAETMKLKSLRNIYISLAKALHPDTETDPTEKLRKEELMKKVTIAYNEKDLPALLQLEMEWVTAESDHLANMPDEKLKLYITSLREQVAELERERNALYHHPRFSNIRHFAHYHEASARREISNMVGAHKKQKKSLEELYSIISKPNPKNAIMEFVNSTIEYFERRSMWDLMNF